MAATSMMKEYVKRQLKYWVDNFKDDMLPRDFNSKGFARPQLTLHKITLKPDKIAALLHVPAPLIVTRATCSELTLKVPSWQLAEKFVQEPLSLRLGDLFVDVKHIDECDEHVRRDSEARARAASVEPDPLGSIASMYQFASVISERLELQVENVYLKLYERQALRVRVELSRFHARTTNALWQDMRDLTDCVDRSPDGLLKTRFKFVSAQCSVYLHETGPGAATAAATTGKDAAAGASPPPIRLLRDHAIAMRVTLFGHRKHKQDNWAVLSRVVDLNLETLPFDVDSAQVRQVYELYATLARWWAAAEADADHAPGHGLLLPHQVERAPPSPSRQAKTADHDADHTGGDNDHGDPGGSTFALQVTVRFTAHVLLRVRSARRRGDVQLAVIAQHAALNWIQLDGGGAELQLTVHDLSVRHKDKVLLHLKPARDVLQVKRLAGGAHAALFVKWHLQKLSCQLENDMAELANELFHSLNEIEQAAAITCGTCHRKIPLDAIERHVCAAASPPASPTTATASAHGAATNGSRHGSASGASGMPDAPSPHSPGAVLLDSTRMPKLRLVLALDELEIATDSHLFRSVQDLARLAAEPPSSSSTPKPPAQRFAVTVKDWSVSTESKEFVGDAIFVPVLPLAFQMLECTIRGCGCVHRQQQKRKRPQKADGVDGEEGADHVPGCGGSAWRPRPRWPDRVFAELGHLAVRATTLATKTETFLTADGASLRLSFSDGHRVCAQSTPQMSCFLHVERIRCQAAHDVVQRVRRALARLQEPLAGHGSVAALTLFFAVLEVRNVELTLLDQDDDKTARVKAQLRHVGGVADNHQGRLALHTNFDFRALLQSEAVTFDFADHEGVGHQEVAAGPTRRERRRAREEAQQASAAQRIQRVFRGFAAKRRRRLELELRRLTHEDEDVAAVAAATQATVARDREASASSSPGSPPESPRRTSGGSKSALFGAAGEDLAAMHPMKMVAAAGVLKDGVLGFVKAKQQLLESEMTDFALQSKESAARFIPKYSAVKNLLSPKTASGSSAAVAEAKKNAELRAAEAGDAAAQEPVARESSGVVDARSGSTLNASSRVESKVSASHDDRPSAQEGAPEEEGKDAEHEREEDEEDKEEEEEEEGEEDDAEEEEHEEEEEEEELDEQRHASSEAEGDKDHSATGDENEGEGGAPEEKHHAQCSDEREPSGAEAALLARLPAVVRLLVQVEEHRLSVPIDPRATVAALASEITRRFNELFGGEHGAPEIERVALQNAQGAVLAGSDVVALACDTAAAARETLLFAYPLAADAAVKSVVRVDRSAIDNDAAASRPGRAFARCSKLPLPLVVALLANESEKDLLRHVAGQDSSGGGGGVADEWPELALNASFLDPARDMLQVEVRWPSGGNGGSGGVHVANRDAFLLCLQQLGLCTNRENSKHVGKVLRDRLKMDAKNPLVRAACRASPEFRLEGDDDGATGWDASYESLKEVVEEDFGVYTRPRESS